MGLSPKLWWWTCAEVLAMANQLWALRELLEETFAAAGVVDARVPLCQVSTKASAAQAEAHDEQTKQHVAAQVECPTRQAAVTMTDPQPRGSGQTPSVNHAWLSECAASLRYGRMPGLAPCANRAAATADGAYGVVNAQMPLSKLFRILPYFVFGDRHRGRLPRRLRKNLPAISDTRSVLV